MSITLLVYLVSILDQLRLGLTLALIIVGIWFTFEMIIQGANICEGKETVRKPIFNKLAVFAVVFSLLLMLLPTTKTGYIIAATAVAEQQQVIGKVLDVPKKVLDILNIELDRIIQHERQK